MYQDPSRAKFLSEYKSLLHYSSISVQHSTLIIIPYFACIPQAGLPAAAGTSYLIPYLVLSSSYFISVTHILPLLPVRRQRKRSRVRTSCFVYEVR